MNDELLYSLQQAPDAAFAAQLRHRLAQDARTRVEHRAAWPLRRVTMAAAVLLIVGGLFAFPGVRASAESFLAMFRVTNFVGVRMDTRALSASTIDLPRLLGEQVVVLQEPGRPVAVASVADAAAAAHFSVTAPSYLPRDARLTDIAVQAPAAVRITADADRLRDVLNALNIRDLEVPPDLDGKAATIRTAPVVRLGYQVRGLSFSLLQTTTPEIALPSGIDLAALGEIALRISGMPRNDASQFAQRIDWHSTILVPVPPNAERFQQVDINGHQGLAIQSIPFGTPSESPRRLASVMWSTGSRVFAVQGTVPLGDVLQIALSIP